MSDFTHIPHPHIAARKKTGPVKVADQRGGGINARIGLRITTIVGTMICAYVFMALALYGLPTALKAGPSGLVLWTSSEFLQLVLLPVIIVGQNVQARAADKRAEATYLDAEAVLHEAQQIQAHLQAQDDGLGALLERAGAHHEAQLDEAAARHQLVMAQAQRQHETLMAAVTAPPAAAPVGERASAPVPPARGKAKEAPKGGM